MMRNERTSIRITKATRTELCRLKLEGETYDQLIDRLVGLAKKDAFFIELDHIADREKPCNRQ